MSRNSDSVALNPPHRRVVLEAHFSNHNLLLEALHLAPHLLKLQVNLLLALHQLQHLVALVPYLVFLNLLCLDQVLQHSALHPLLLLVLPALLSVLRQVHHLVNRPLHLAHLVLLPQPLGLKTLHLVRFLFNIANRLFHKLINYQFFCH